MLDLVHLKQTWSFQIHTIRDTEINFIKYSLKCEWDVSLAVKMC